MGDQALSEFVEPAYQQRSLGDVVPAVAAALGAGQVGVTPSGLTFPDAGSYVIFLIDGLGAELLRRHADDAPFLAALLQGQAAGTAGVPSTTVTSLTSLGTGLPPGAHGMVGFTARIPGTDRLLNGLFWDDTVMPEEWQPHDTAFAQVARAGIEMTLVNKREFARSGLTRAAHRGAAYVGADRLGERIAAVAAAARVTPSVTYMYEGDLDWTGHQYGVASRQWRDQLAMVDAEAERVRESLPRHARLVVVADHGMVDSPAHSRIDIAALPELSDGVALVGGEARFRHLYCRHGAVDDVVDRWRAILGGRAEVLTRGEAAGRGWFGAVDPLVNPRIGDVVVACRGDLAVLETGSFPYEADLIGLHGSLTPDEMLIPILIC
ncbi:alkaline phosphatase family protein [Nocardioides limicola]|uniref:alkaline phosphatase family protein n=1 Tax=Nocardioides limicola TaxID=2803368 RepID=UPI00193C0E8E|nr:nucleotide pyrophosphatase/phosphodiesterase family protein [Nocardioides sp. DJM-14]